MLYELPNDAEKANAFIKNPPPNASTLSISFENLKIPLEELLRLPEKINFVTFTGTDDTYSRQNFFGVIHYYQGHYTEAMREFAKTLLCENAEDPTAMTYTAQIKYAWGRKKEAKDQLNTVIQDNPTNYYAALVMARWLIAEKQHEEALKYFDAFKQAACPATFETCILSYYSILFLQCLQPRPKPPELNLEPNEKTECGICHDPFNQADDNIVLTLPNKASLAPEDAHAFHRHCLFTHVSFREDKNPDTEAPISKALDPLTNLPIGQIIGYSRSFS